MRTHEFYIADQVWIVSATGSRDDVFLHLVPQSADALWVRAAEENLASKDKFSRFICCEGVCWGGEHLALFTPDVEVQSPHTCTQPS